MYRFHNVLALLPLWENAELVFLRYRSISHILQQSFLSQVIDHTDSL